MATAELTRPAAFEIQPITFEATKDALEQMVAQSSSLIVGGIDDKQGIAAVHERRLEYKNLRVSIEKRRKELKAEHDAKQAAAVEREAAERARIEALRPDREKLLAFADTVQSLELPHLSAAAGDIARDIKALLAESAGAIRSAVTRLK